GVGVAPLHAKRKLTPPRIKTKLARSRRLIFCSFGMGARFQTHRAPMTALNGDARFPPLDDDGKRMPSIHYSRQICLDRHLIWSYSFCRNLTAQPRGTAECPGRKSDLS